MRFITFQTAQGPRVGAVRDGRYVDLASADPTLPWTLKELLVGGDDVKTAPGRGTLHGCQGRPGKRAIATADSGAAKK